MVSSRGQPEGKSRHRHRARQLSARSSNLPVDSISFSPMRRAKPVDAPRQRSTPSRPPSPPGCQVLCLETRLRATRSSNRSTAYPYVADQAMSDAHPPPCAKPLLRETCKPPPRVATINCGGQTNKTMAAKEAFLGPALQSISLLPSPTRSCSALSASVLCQPLVPHCEAWGVPSEPSKCRSVLSHPAQERIAVQFVQPSRSCTSLPCLRQTKSLLE